MPQVIVRGESVYQCTVCNRKTRVPTNQKGLDVLYHCTITAGCKGKLNRVTLMKDIITTPTLTPAVAGLQDWFQRKSLYVHHQSVSSNKWVINHRLNNKPIIHTFINKVEDGVMQLVSIPTPTTVTVDSDTTELVFDGAVTGVAQCVTLSSQNATNPPVAQIVDTTTPTQVSNNVGLLTIATLISDPTLDLLITFDITGQSSVTINYDQIGKAAATSAWNGSTHVFLNGLKYTIRSVNLLSHPAAISFFKTGQIPPQGGSFYIEYINKLPPMHGEVVILGATAPFGPVDRVFNQYVDFGDETTNTHRLLYSFGQVYATSTAIKNAYPLITVV